MSIEGLPKGLHRAAFGAFVREVKEHPLFANRRIVTAWRTWEGKGSNAVPTTSAMPCVQFRLVGGPVRRVASTRRPGGAATVSYELRPTVAVETWVKGSDQGDASDLADLIYDVLAPQDDAARKAMQTRLGAVGIRDWRPTAPILPPSLEAYADAWIYSVGTYQLTIFVNG